MNNYVTVEKLVLEIGEATRQNQKNLSHHRSWWGWREGGKIHLRTTSGAAKRQSEWGFLVPEVGYFIFHNSTRNAYCVLRTPPGCPVMKFLFDQKWSYRIIRRHRPGEQVLLEGLQQNLHCHYPSARSTVPWTAENTPVTLGEGGCGRPTNYWWGQNWKVVASGPWAVVLEEVADHNGLVSKQVAEIHLWEEPMFMYPETLQSLLKVLWSYKGYHTLPVVKHERGCSQEFREVA